MLIEASLTTKYLFVLVMFFKFSVLCTDQKGDERNLTTVCGDVHVYYSHRYRSVLFFTRKEYKQSIEIQYDILSSYTYLYG